MKCIYCNSETELTESDIITYAITGAKLTKQFVCKKHNAFTNDTYEKKFVEDLDFLRNHLGIMTRDGKTIKYSADILDNGTILQNVKISNRESLYAPKDVVTGFNDRGNKILMAPVEKLKKISKGKGKISIVDTSGLTLHKTISLKSFLGFYAIHSVAKMAYEWYCYINKIYEFKEEHKDIVDYILGYTDSEFVDIIIDGNYYNAIDQLSEIGTNAFFQYDDFDGYRYVVFDFWKTIAYRIKICQSPQNTITNTKVSILKLYLYHMDKTKTRTEFGVYSIDNKVASKFSTINPTNVSTNMLQCFKKRIEKILSTMILSIHNLKKEVDKLAYNLDKYDKEIIDISQLLGFEDSNIIITIEIINQLHINKEKYDITKTFNQNLHIILNLDGDTISRTQEEKNKFLKYLIAMHKENKLSEYIWNGIHAFNKIYNNEIKPVK